MVCAISMSAFEIVPAPKGCLSLRDMEPGASWISPAYLGVSPEEQIASRDGTMTPERHREIYEAAQRANEELANMTVPGVQEWMPLRRILS